MAPLESCAGHSIRTSGSTARGATPTRGARIAALRCGMARCTSGPATAASWRLMQRKGPRCGRPRCATPTRPGSLQRRASAMARCSRVGPAWSTTSEEGLSRLTRRQARRPGRSGPRPAIRRNRSNRKRWRRWPRPGTENRGSSVAPTSGTRSPTTLPRTYC